MKEDDPKNRFSTIGDIYRSKLQIIGGSFVYKRKISVLLLLTLLISFTGCTSEDAAGIQDNYNNSTSSAEVGNAKTWGSQSESYEGPDSGEIFDKEMILLPNINVTLQQAETVGNEIFLFGYNQDKVPAFYLMDKTELSAEELNIARDNEIYLLCSSSDGSLPVLTINEEGNYVLLIYNGESLVRSLTLPILAEYEDNLITEFSVTETGFIVLTATDVLVLNTDGELTENLGSYQRTASCLLNEDGTALIARTMSVGLGSNAMRTEIDLLDAGLSKTASYTCDGQFDDFYWDCGENAVLAHSGRTLFLLDYLNGTKEALIDTSASGINTSYLISLGEGKFFSLEQGNVFICYPSDSNKVTTITLAAYQINNTLSDLVNQYNKNNASCKIKVVDYVMYDDAGGEGAGLERLKADIIAGFTPDLYDLSSLPAELYASRGLFEDLSPWLSGDAPALISDLVPSAVEALAIEEKLYYICPSFTVLTLYGDKSFVGEKGYWTPDDFFSAIRGVPPVSIFGPEVTREDFLAYVLLFQGDEYINKEDLSCHFTDSSFQQFLEFAAQLPADDSGAYDSNTYGRAYAGAQLLVLEWLGTLPCSWISYANAIFNGDAQFVGFPSSVSFGFAFVPSALVSISASSPHKDAAIDFIYFMLSDASQMGRVPDFPVVQCDLEGIMAGWMVWEESRIHVLHASYDGLPLEIEGEMPTEKEESKVYEIINKSILLAQFDNTLLELILRECNPYFNGQISSQQAVSNIQSKAQIYVSEQFG